MFDLTSSKLLILGIVALIVVGPKELPFLLRTIGKYVGMMRRHANDFRAQFDEAMRDAELQSIKDDLEKVAKDATATLDDAHASVDRELHAADQEIHHSIKAPSVEASAVDPVHTFDALNGLEAPHAEPVPMVPEAPKTGIAHAGEHAEVPSTSGVASSNEPVAMPAQHPAGQHDRGQHALASSEIAQPALAKTGS